MRETEKGSEGGSMTTTTTTQRTVPTSTSGTAASTACAHGRDVEARERARAAESDRARVGTPSPPSCRAAPPRTGLDAAGPGATTSCRRRREAGAGRRDEAGQGRSAAAGWRRRRAARASAGAATARRTSREVASRSGGRRGRQALTKPLRAWRGKVSSAKVEEEPRWTHLAVLVVAAGSPRPSRP